MYQVSPDLAIVSTVDFITPPVDDPYWFGQIAAANSLSDVYAMGGRPLTALNLVMFPIEKLDISFLKEILRGGHDKVLEANASMAGGHSVEDEEPKYGLAVTGVIDPSRILTNCGAADGDSLVLTKPLGTGVLFNALRAGKLLFRDIEHILLEVSSLNKIAIETALKYDIHACTDITGFGVMGHSLEMARGSGVTVSLSYRDIPVYPVALDMYRKGVTTKSNASNRALGGERVRIGSGLSGPDTEILYDPQTSGGLLIALPSSQAERLVRELRDAGVRSAAIVGSVMQRGTLDLEVS